MSEWPARDSAPPLGPQDVHVWRAQLSELRGDEDELSLAERQRAERFAKPKLRQRFVASRSVLRTLLAGYLGLPHGRDLRIEEPAGEKPRLDPVVPLRFNLSHSGDTVLWAFALEREIGVDVEVLDPGKADRELARRFFAPGEVRWLEGCPPEDWPAAFFRCWTRKEAILKATGKGMSLGLSRFEVSCEPNADPLLLQANWDPAVRRDWHLSDVDLGPQFKAALAVEAGPLAQCHYTWRA